MKVERTTRQCTMSELHPVLNQAIQEFFRSYKLGDPQAETRLCCETLTVRRPATRWLPILEGNLDKESRFAALLTSDWFVWSTSGDKSGTVVAGVRLKVLHARVMVTHRSEELRLEITGFINDSKEYVHGTFELGAGPAAARFCEAVNAAALEQNPPLPKDRRRWFGI